MTDLLELISVAGASINDDLTPRELFFMARARASSMWDHTSSLLAAIHNALAKSPKSPDEFHPLKERNMQHRKTKGDRR